MPKREASTISHSALTNHQIPARPAKNVPAEPDVVHVNKPEDGSAVPKETLLEAYDVLAAKDERFRDRLRLLSQELRESTSPAVMAIRARQDLSSVEAVSLLERAVEAPSPSPQWIADLSEALVRNNRSADAIRALERGLKMAPHSALLHKALALRLLKSGETARAVSVLTVYVKRFPEDARSRETLEQLQSGLK
jgi:predicted Zn-dependent protease